MNEQKLIVTTKNDIAFTGMCRVIGNYVCIKQSDKSDVFVLILLESIKFVLNLKGKEIKLEKSEDEDIQFDLIECREHIVKVKGGITYAGIEANCNNMIASDSVILCINEKLMYFVIIPKYEIVKEWK